MPIQPTSLDVQAETDEEIFLEANERLRISMEANGNNTTLAIEDLEFEDGNQWPDDLYNMRKVQKRPTLTINMTRRAVREVCNNMRQQRPRIKVHPTGDGAKIEEAKVWAGLIRDIENKSNADYAYDTAGESAVKMGWGYARIFGDYISPDSFEQELLIRAIRNPFTVYDDPTAVLPTGADRDWLLITEEMKRQKYKRLYPKADNAEWTHGGTGDNIRLWESKEKIRLAEYYRIKHVKSTLHRLSNGTAVYTDELKKHGDSWAAQGITATGETRPTTKRTIQWFRINGRKVIDRRDLPGRWIPVVRCEGNVLDLNGEIRRRGMVRDLKDTNRMLNYWATCETELVALAPRAPFVAAAGQLDGHAEWKDANQKPYSALIYNVVHSNPEDPNSPVLPPPQRQEAVQIPAGVVNARQGAQQDLLMLAGMPHEPTADLPGTVVSGKALRERQAMTDRAHFQYYDNQTRFIEHIGEILVDLIPHYYSAQRTVRIIGEDGVPEMVGINQPDAQSGEIKHDMQAGRYDVVMDTGPGYETKRQEGQEAVLDLLKTPLAEPIVKAGSDLIVRNMDFAGADDLADRLLPSSPQGMDKAIKNLPKEAQGIIHAMQQQLQQAQQVIQEQALQIKYKGDIEKGWMAVENRKIDEQSATKLHDTSINAQTKVFDTHVKSITARDVAEINAGAKIIDSNKDREHEKELAKITAEAAEKAMKNGDARE